MSTHTQKIIVRSILVIGWIILTVALFQANGCSTETPCGM